MRCFEIAMMRVRSWPMWWSTCVPGHPDDAARDLPEADELRSVILSRSFSAVGKFYANFDQVSDAEVLALLREARER